jgi:hypothetical protein
MQEIDPRLSTEIINKAQKIPLVAV